MSSLRRLKRTFLLKELGDEIDEELQAHIAMRTADNEAAGLTPTEARRDALIRFGNVNATKEKVAGAKSFLWIPVLLSDLRLSFRRLRKTPVFTLAAVVTLALGIGANVSIFSVVEAVLLRPLPYSNPDRLVVIWQADAAHHGVAGWFNSYREYEVWKENSKSFEKLAPLTWATEGKTLLWHGDPIDTLAIPTGMDFFAMLGVAPQLGRTFGRSDLTETCTLVLSHKFWQVHLSADANVVGKTVSMSGQECHIVGVMPVNFSFYPTQTDAWTLITPSSDFAKNPWTSLTGVFGLLRPGVTSASAQSELTALQSRVVGEAPPEKSILKTMNPSVQALQANFTWLAGRGLKTALSTATGAVTVILIMACINLATLQFGKAGQRTREIATRSALGASRSRLFLQLFSESLVIGIAGTLVGLVLAFALLKWFKASNPIELPPGNQVTIDWRVAAFAVLIGIVSAILFGLAPAWTGSRSDLSTVLRSGERGNVAGRATRAASQWFVGLQVALSLVLLTSAGLLGESLWKVSETRLGYRTDHLLTATVKLPVGRYKEDSSKEQLASALEQEAMATPGVRAVGLASDVVPKGATVLSVAGRATSDEASDSVATQALSPSVFSVLNLKISRGRAFDVRDHSSTQNVAVINEALARKYFGDSDPLGRTLKLSKAEDTKVPWLTIVGVVSNVKTTTVFQDTGYIESPAVYLPIAQNPPSTLMYILQIDLGFELRVLQRQVSSLDGELLLTNIETVEHQQEQALSQPRFRAFLFSGFALLALLLAVVGLYGVLHQSVLRRTREIGIRMAVGADRRMVLLSVLKQAAVMVGIGIVLGLGGSTLVGRLLRSFLYEVRIFNPLLIGGASALMMLVGLFAAIKPARRAASTNPVEALRID